MTRSTADASSWIFGSNKPALGSLLVSSHLPMNNPKIGRSRVLFLSDEFGGTARGNGPVTGGRDDLP